MRLALLIAALIFIVANCAGVFSALGGQTIPMTPADGAVETGQAGFLFKSATGDGRTITYVEYVPRGLDLSRPAPLVVFLHGSGECGEDGQKQVAVGIGTNIIWHAERWPCIVLIPQKPVQRAQWEDYDGAVMQMVAQAKKDHRIDADRISLTGLSQGGHGVWSIGMRHPEMWCALAPICAYADMHGGGTRAEEIAEKVKSIPVWCFHGEKDPVVPVSQAHDVLDAIRVAARTSEHTRLTVYPGVGHEAWDKAYAEADLPRFLMTAKKK
jgi:predicted peptidase